MAFTDIKAERESIKKEIDKLKKEIDKFNEICLKYQAQKNSFDGYKMIYMQRGNYVVVVNPLSYSEVMSADHSLSWGVYDTVTNAFFSVSQKANVSLLNSMIRDKESVFQKDNRFYTVVKSPKRPIAAIVSTSNKRFYETLYHQATLTLPLGMICSIIILLVWSRTHRELNSPGRLLHRALHKRQLCLHYQPIIDIKNNQ
mgnify:CR=1 FL=1